MPTVHRRSLIIGSVSVALAGGHRGAAAQPAGQPGRGLTPLQQLGDLEERARRAGVPAPAGDAARASPLPVQDAEAYSELMPRLVDLIDRADASRSANDVAEEAAELLGRITRAERSLARSVDPEGRARPPPSFDSLREEYRRLFDGCAIEAKYQSKVNGYVENLKKYRPRYEKVGQALGIPWHFIASIHALEASFNFRTHLHNGDPLTNKTVQVPAGRPPVWDPPNDWESSADDALTMTNFNGQQDWSLERTLYRWEAYNGFGYRGRTSDGMPVFSPYLLSYSNQYKKGKYVRDGVWDANAVSQQCGAVTMLIGLVQAGEVAKP